MVRKSVLLGLCLVASAGLTLDVNDIAMTEDDLRSAARFGLDIDQWRRYKEHMAGDGQYSEKVHPLMTLGIITQDDAERRALAYAYAERELAEIQGTLNFSDAFSRAVEQIAATDPRYSEKMLDMSKVMQHYNGNGSKPDYQTGDEIKLILDLDRPDAANLAFRRAYSLYRTQDRLAVKMTLHLYFAGNLTDRQIKAWASNTPIQPLDTITKRITLNHLNEQSEPESYHRVVVYRGGEVIEALDP